MKLLIVAAIAAISAIVTVLVLDQFDHPWRNPAISTGIAGAVAGVVSVLVARKLRKES